MIDEETISAWRINYNLDRFTPEQAMRWWSEHFDGKAPAGAVAALGLCLQEIDALRRLLADAQAALVPHMQYVPGTQVLNLASQVVERIDRHLEGQA